jgi:hypothetical protein
MRLQALRCIAHRRAGDGSAQPLGKGQTLLGAAMAEQQHAFLPAEAGHQVAGTQRPAHRCAHDHQGVALLLERLALTVVVLQGVRATDDRGHLVVAQRRQRLLGLLGHQADRRRGQRHHTATMVATRARICCGDRAALGWAARASMPSRADRRSASARRSRRCGWGGGWCARHPVVSAVARASLTMARTANAHKVGTAPTAPLPCLP